MDKRMRERAKRYLARKLSKQKKQELYDAKKWYTIRSLLGHQHTNWIVIIGSRELGKTFSVQDYVLGCFFNPKSPLYHVPFYWMRLSDAALNSMKQNNGAKMFEPLLVEKYGLEEIKVRGDSVFLGELLLCRVYSLSTAYNQKGAAVFNAKTFKGVNIIVDEIAYEKGQPKRTDVAYNLKMQVENICRHERKNVKIFIMMNNTEDCPEVLTSCFGFIPVEFGRYKLKRKHCVIDYVPNNKAYEERRKTALANEIDKGTGNFTNKVVRDIALIYKGRLCKPSYVVKFSKSQEDWYTVWDGNIICAYNGEKVNSVAMKRYIDDIFIPEARDSVIEQEDVRAYKYKSLLVQSTFRKNLEIIKK